MIALIFASISFLVVQWVFHRYLGPPKPVGDEIGYLREATAADPHKPLNFLRVPLFAEFFVWSSRLTGKAENANWMILIAGTVSALGTMFAVHLGGLNVMFALVAFLLAPELLIFNRRYWPEPVLALMCGIITVLLWRFPNAHGLVFGLVIAFAVMIRIEQLVLMPAVGVAWALADKATYYWDWIGLSMPVALCIGLWTWRCWNRYRIPWPDTTWMFNLEIANRESREKPLSLVNIEYIIKAQLKDQRQANGRPQSVRDRLSNMYPGVLRMPVRWLAMLGRETFIVDRLMAPNNNGFPHAVWNMAAVVWIRYGFTVLSCCIIFTAMLVGHIQPYLVPTLALFLVISSVHGRTRYRTILLPGLAIWFADVMARVDLSQLLVSWYYLFAAAILGALVASISLRVEN